MTKTPSLVNSGKMYIVSYNNDTKLKFFRFFEQALVFLKECK